MFVGTGRILICLLGTGNQTFAERENSFQVITWYHSMLLDCWVLFCCDQVSETVSVHIGFFNENGGFRISDEDKKFMRGCQIVVSTCAFGGGNNLYQPIGMSKASTQKVCHSDSLELFLFLNTSLVLFLNYSVCRIPELKFFCCEFRFATLPFGMMLHSQRRKQRVVRLEFSFDKFLDNIRSFIKTKATNIHKPY